MKHSGGGLLRRVLLRSSIVTRFSLEVLLEEASPAFVLGACLHFLAVILFTFLWHRLMMPLPEGTYAQRNQSWTLHSSRKVLSWLLQKAVLLSVRISVGGPRSYKSAFSWLITLVASCWGRCHQMANRARPQSITIKKWTPLQWVISIATRCHVCSNIQSPFWPVHGCRIDWLILFTFSDDGFHCGLRDPRGNLSHKIKCLTHTRMTALSVNNLDQAQIRSWTQCREAAQAQCSF